MNIKSGIALLAAALLSTTAMAQPSRALLDSAQTRTEMVKYKPSEVATPEGAAGLYSKLYDAALRVCSDETGAAADSLEACVAAALDEAVRSVSAPQVSAMHRASKPVVLAATR
jgi:UrcA family protein